MDNIEITEATDEPRFGIVPSHKISITHGSDVYIYWYAKQNQHCRDFNKMKDMDLVKLMHAKGTEMKLGFSESFQLSNIKDYSLEHKGSHEFIIKSLK